MNKGSWLHVTEIARRVGIWVGLLAIIISPVLLPVQAGAAPVGGKRAAVFMPFGGGGRTGTESPVDHTAWSGVGYGFAWDLHGGTSIPVYPKVTSNDGNVTMHIDDIDTSGSAGSRVVVSVRVDNVFVGKMKFSHLVNLGVSEGQANITAMTRLGDTASDAVIGGCRGFACDQARWLVTSVSGIHTHVEYSQACYGAQGINQNVGSNDAIVMFSQNWAANNKSNCDANELATIGTAYAPVVMTRPNGETNVIAVTSSHKLVYHFSSGGPWSSIDITGDGGAYSAPSAVLRSNGEIGIVVLAPGNNLDYYSRAPGAASWSRSTFAHGIAFGNPSMILRANGELNVVVRGPGDSLDYYFSTSGASWNRMTIAGNGSAKSDPALAQRANGEVNVVVGGPGNRLDYYYYNAGWNLHTVDNASNVAMYKPAIIQRPDGEFDIVTTTAAHTLNFYYNPPGWNYFGALEIPNSQAYSAPAVVLRPSGEVNITVMGPNQTADYYFNAQGSPTWGKIGMTSPYGAKSAPSMIQRASGETNVVVTNSAYNTHYYINMPNSQGWNVLSIQ